MVRIRNDAWIVDVLLPAIAASLPRSRRPAHRVEHQDAGGLRLVDAQMHERGELELRACWCRSGHDRSAYRFKYSVPCQAQLFARRAWRISATLCGCVLGGACVAAIACALCNLQKYFPLTQ